MKSLLKLPNKKLKKWTLFNHTKIRNNSRKTSSQGKYMLTWTTIVSWCQQARLSLCLSTSQQLRTSLLWLKANGPSWELTFMFRAPQTCNSQMRAKSLITCSSRKSLWKTSSEVANKIIWFKLSSRSKIWLKRSKTKIKRTNKRNKKRQSCSKWKI